MYARQSTTIPCAAIGTVIGTKSLLGASRFTAMTIWTLKVNSNSLMGTDVPNPGVTGGFSAHEELADMARTFGMSPYQALRTATVNAARSLGISGSKGMLKPGMDADILILEKNPLEDIANTETFCAVIREGTYHDKAECEAVLARVRQYRDEEIEALM